MTKRAMACLWRMKESLVEDCGSRNAEARVAVLFVSWRYWEASEICYLLKPKAYMLGNVRER
jgi:hypothetical protein